LKISKKWLKLSEKIKMAHPINQEEQEEEEEPKYENFRLKMKF
jgi:hypothetical protein